MFFAVHSREGSRGPRTNALKPVMWGRLAGTSPTVIQKTLRYLWRFCSFMCRQGLRVCRPEKAISDLRPENGSWPCRENREKWPKNRKIAWHWPEIPCSGHFPHFWAVDPWFSRWGKNLFLGHFRAGGPKSISSQSANSQVKANCTQALKHPPKGSIPSLRYISWFFRGKTAEAVLRATGPATPTGSLQAWPSFGQFLRVLALWSVAPPKAPRSPKQLKWPN